MKVIHPGRPSRRGGRPAWHLDRDLARVRREFPILERGIYLISNSQGAVPRAARAYLEAFYNLWEREGVTAWQKEWWDLGVAVGVRVAEIIGASSGQVTMMTNATQAHWVALSTQFLPRAKDGRRKVVLSDQDFPSILYAVEGISRFMGWEPVVVRSGSSTFEPGPLLRAMDERTLFVATSHVHYKTAYVQDVREICRRARRLGALSLIDGYHAPGVIPVNVREVGADFYIGGCLKWLCGGPGTAFLYVRPETAARLKPRLTGWAGHRNPFLFSPEMDYADASRRFQSGTPAIPSLYTAQAGLDMITRVGLAQIRKKSLELTDLIMTRAGERRFPIFTPKDKELRGGHVAFHLPHAFPMKQALEARGIRTDFRKGGPGEPDLLRVGPHFYNKKEEVEALFLGIDRILASGAYKKYPTSVRSVT